MALAEWPEPPLYVLSFDWSKAFDKINHDGLLHARHRMGTNTEFTPRQSPTIGPSTDGGEAGENATSETRERAEAAAQKAARITNHQTINHRLTNHRITNHQAKLQVGERTIGTDGSSLAPQLSYIPSRAGATVKPC